MIPSGHSLLVEPETGKRREDEAITLPAILPLELESKSGRCRSTSMFGLSTYLSSSPIHYPLQRRDSVRQAMSEARHQESGLSPKQG